MRRNRHKPPKEAKQYRCRACGWIDAGPLPKTLGDEEYCPACKTAGGVVGPVWKGMKS
jgi:rubrerythrin